MKLQISNPTPGQVFYIDALGRMPELRFEACLLNSQNQPMHAPLQWTLQITENIWPGACASAKLGRQVVQLQGTSVGLGIWIPVFNAHCGGDAILTVTAQYQGEDYQASVHFKIRGKNPASDAVVEYIGGELAPLTWLARFVSGLNQFDIQGMPLSGKHGAVGIMQLCNPAAQPHQRWSWVHNVQAGMSLLQRQQGNAKAYLNQHRLDGDAGRLTAIPTTMQTAHPNANQYPNSESLSDDQVLLREILQRFLGDAYWQWDENIGQWRPNPPDDSVAEVLRLK
ncbi:MAG: hypothetical protein LJE85_15380 [Gammaproteobacteria bacterium]|jgi:hypothetical protein|nr:hypothetical protein [Gammaproteobacteria bacterium]